VAEVRGRIEDENLSMIEDRFSREQAILDLQYERASSENSANSAMLAALTEEHDLRESNLETARLTQEANREQDAEIAANAEKAKAETDLADLLGVRDELKKRRSLADRRPVSVEAIDRGFLTRAPGPVEPWQEMRQQQKTTNKKLDDVTKTNQQAVKVLDAILVKLGPNKTVVADF
jgi:hypothetical protein